MTPAAIDYPPTQRIERVETSSHLQFLMHSLLTNVKSPRDLDVQLVVMQAELIGGYGITIRAPRSTTFINSEAPLSGESNDYTPRDTTLGEFATWSQSMRGGDTSMMLDI